VRDRVAQVGQRLQFQLEVAFAALRADFADAQLAQRLEIRQAVQEQDALDQRVGVLHLVDRFVVFVRGELLQSQFFSILACRKYWLIAVSSLVERLVEELDGLGIAISLR
jgi:hypothetical protein